MKMDAENNDDQSSENNSQSQQEAEQPPTSKLRDLRPEKDPMGAGRAAQDPIVRHPKGSGL